MAHIFISHASADDGFVSELRRTLQGLDFATWDDARGPRVGDMLDAAIVQAIEEAAVFLVVLSPDTFNSLWVRYEVRQALEVQRRRGKEDYPIIPIMLPGVMRSALWIWFGDGVKPDGVTVDPQGGGLYGVLPELMEMMGAELPAGFEPPEQKPASPAEEQDPGTRVQIDRISGGTVAVGAGAQAIERFVQIIIVGDVVDRQDIIAAIQEANPDLLGRLAYALSVRQEEERANLEDPAAFVPSEASKKQIEELLAAERQVAAQGQIPSAETYYLLGILAAYQGDLKLAVGYFRQVVAEDPDYFIAADAINVIESIRSTADKIVDDLTLELSDPRMVESAGTYRAAAQARVIYEPVDPAMKRIKSKIFNFSAPVGAIELNELAWYLEDYFRWATNAVISGRAKKVEEQLPEWGKLLFDTAFAAPAAQNALNAWRSSAGHDLRFSVEVNFDDVEDDGEAATQLLSLPWELLHDCQRFLLQGGRTVRTRRCIPVQDIQKRQLSTLPIRILLISPRPELYEDGQTELSYIDHRAAALPLVKSMEHLGTGIVRLKILHPPTLNGLVQELRRAKEADEAYDIVHFDGHGVFNREAGLGALCFEDPRDVRKAGKRRLELVDAQSLAEKIADYGTPLIFLDACQTAQSKDQPNTSVAARLLQNGTTSVVAMSHSVLVETSHLFGQEFYQHLAAGQTVGAAMAAGQRLLQTESYRGPGLGGDLYLQDWFVPVLYQETRDPQLFSQILPLFLQAMLLERPRRQWGDLPGAPAHQFVGRSRELLRMERLLRQEDAQYLLVLGTGGAGKTTIAAEGARWLLRSGQFERAAFVSTEKHGHADTILNRIGQQLLPAAENYNVAQYGGWEKGLKPVERALREQATLIVLDNMESVLPRRAWALGGGEEGLPDAALSAQESLFEAILALCARLLEADPRTRLIFTSRERLPAPFDRAGRVVALGALDWRDGVKLVENVLSEAGLQPPVTDTGDDLREVEALVQAVKGHARALVLLAPEVARLGVKATQADLGPIMARLEAAHPGERENSLFASVELSLRRLPEDVQDKARRLAVFHDGGHVANLAHVMGVEVEEARQIAIALIEVGLAEDLGDGYLSLDPALPDYWKGQLTEEELSGLQNRWAEAQVSLVEYLYEEHFQDAVLSARLTRLERANLAALLRWLEVELVQGRAEAAGVAQMARQIEQLAANQDLVELLAAAEGLRERAAKALGDWSHSAFENERSRIERLLGRGEVAAAVEAAQKLLQRALAEGAEAYAGAAYDLAMAYNSLGKALGAGGGAGQALPLLEEAQRRFQALAAEGNQSAARMAAVTLGRQGDSLQNLGRLEESAAVYEEAIKLAEERGDKREGAVGLGNLGTVRMVQGKTEEALAAFKEARERFAALGEPQSVAMMWHQTGNSYKEANDWARAEAAYQEALNLKVQIDDQAGQARTLNELGNLYDAMERLEEAVAFYRQAADLAVSMNDLFKEGLRRSNIADTLLKLGRPEEAREEIERAIECDKPFGHAAEPWKTWGILHDIEQAAGDAAAAKEAWREAREAYLAYRRDGGYAQSGLGELGDQIWRDVDQGETVAAIKQKLASQGEREDVPEWVKSFLSKLGAVLDGSRERSFADDMALDYWSAAELLLLIERLEGE